MNPLSAVLAASMLSGSLPISSHKCDLQTPPADMERLVRTRTVAWLSGDADVYNRYTSETSPEPKVPSARRIPPFDIDHFEIVDYPELTMVNYVLTVYRDEEEGAPFMRHRRTEVWVSDGVRWKEAPAQSLDLAVPDEFCDWGVGGEPTP